MSNHDFAFNFCRESNAENIGDIVAGDAKLAKAVIVVLLSDHGPELRRSVLASLLMKYAEEAMVEFHNDFIRQDS